MQGEGEQAHHHALVGFGRMARDRQSVIAVVTAVDISDGKLDFEDRGFECHLAGDWTGMPVRPPEFTGTPPITPACDEPIGKRDIN